MSDSPGTDGAQPEPVVAVTVALVTALIAAGLSQRRSLALAGMSRSSWHYRANPRSRVADPVAHTARRAASWLEPDEQDTILGRLRAAFARGASVYQAYYEALDVGDPVASLSTWYRLARRLEPHRPVRRRAKHRASAVPSLLADAPLQAWSWDIERHEALLSPAVVRGHRWRPVAAGRLKLRTA